MTEQNQTPYLADDDDAEGHYRKPLRTDDDTDRDDAEGHYRKPLRTDDDQASSDDTEGHYRKPF